MILFTQFIGSLITDRYLRATLPIRESKSFEMYSSKRVLLNETNEFKLQNVIARHGLQSQVKAGGGILDEVQGNL